LLGVSCKPNNAGCIFNDAIRIGKSALKLPNHMTGAPSVRRFIELYAPGKGISLPKARLVVAQNSRADASLETLRAGCRFLLRQLIYRSSGTPQADWALLHTATGAPYLCCNGTRSPLNVSTAHSGPWLAVGLSIGAQIGVDIEQVKPRKNFPGIADILGWKGEVRDLAEFLSRWTLREARAKCVGSTLLARPDPVFEQLEQRPANKRVGKAGHWFGLHDRLGKNAHYAIVLKSQHEAKLVHRHLEPGKIEAW
jgi:phosphopantetheinyl transferase